MPLEIIKEFVKNKHGNQKRKQGTPYYLHPFEVADILEKKGYDIDYQIAGLFHDLLEDTETTEYELLKLSNKSIVEAVKLLTKENGYTMSDYINRIEKNEIAKAVKLADRLHNLLEAHLASKEFIIKYVNETEQWYLKIAKNTSFEYELLEVVKNLRNDLI